MIDQVDLTSNVHDAFEAAVRSHQMGRLNDAERIYRQVLAVDSRHTDALHLLGVIAHQRGRNDRAVALIGRAIALNGQAAACHSNLGNALKELGKLDEAVAAYSAALCIKPDYADAYSNLGIALKKLGRLDQAVAAYGAALRLNPDYAEGHSNLGNALQTLGRIDEAVESYAAAIRVKPVYADAHYNLGNALKALERLDEAVTSYGAALCIKPDYTDAYYNLGLALKELGRLDGAIAANLSALSIMPDHAEARYNLGIVLKELGHLEQAVAANLTTLCIKPDYAEAHYNLGIILKDWGRLEEAIAANRAALSLKPNYAEAHCAESLALLLAGDFMGGWQKYEWRWRGGFKQLKARGFIQSQWRGEDISGRTVLLHAEQGLGDCIQFCRYTSRVAARGGRVVLEAPRSILRLLSGLAGVDRWVAFGDPLPDFDVHCPLMSLPQVFGTTVDTIPGQVPYLSAEPDRVAVWQDRLAASDFRIGIAWQGSPSYMSDNKRSIPLACFSSLARMSGVRLISLQKTDGLDQLENLPAGMKVESLGPDFDAGADAFIDTAAVMMSMDLIITADTAVGHLAGALGLPVWLPLTKIPHWVWMLEREDTPWYPNTRLFRQRTCGDWNEVFERMATELESLMTGNKGTMTISPTPEASFRPS